jgi:diguanylate cyclase (GGDEF)-like protein
MSAEPTDSPAHGSVGQPGSLVEALAATARLVCAQTRAVACTISRLDDGQARVLVSLRRGARHEASEGVVWQIAACPLAAQAVASGQPAMARRLNDPRLSDHLREEHFRRLSYASTALIPLMFHGQTVGLLELLDTRSREFEPVLGDVVAAGTLIAAALARPGGVAEREEALHQLVELGTVVTKTRDIGTLVSAVAQRLIKAVDVTCCEIFMLEGSTLRCKVSLDKRPDYADESADDPAELEWFPSSAQAVQTGEVLVIASPEDPRLHARERAMFARWGFVSQLSIPLRIEERTVGLIDLFDVRARDYAQHLDFARSVGQIVSGAFDNALLLERLEESNRSLRLLADSGLEFGASLIPEKVLETVARRMCVAGGAHTCDIYAVDGDVLRGLVSVEGDVLDEQFPGTVYRLEDFWTASEVIRLGAPVSVPDIVADKRLTPHERQENLRFGFRALVEFPLVTPTAVVGVACLYAKRPGEFAQPDLLRGLGQVAAQAMANAALYRDLDRYAERLRLVTESGIEFSSSLDPSEILTSTARRLGATTGTDCCDIYRLRGASRLECVASILDGEIDEDWLHQGYDLNDWRIAKLAIETREPVVIESPDDPRLTAGERAWMGEWDQRSGLIVPLTAHDQVIGVVELFARHEERTFGTEEIVTAQAVCRVAALALANGDLFERLQERNRETELLNAIAQKTAASLHMDAIAAAAVQELQPMVPSEQSNLLLFAAEGMSTLYTSLPQAMRFQGLPLDAWPAEFFERLKRDKVLVLALPEESPLGPDHPANADLRAAINIALFTEGELVGSLNLGSTKPGIYATVDRGLLERVGTQLSLALNNARLYEDIKDMHVSNLGALSAALNARDYYALGHAARVSTYMVLLGRRLGWEADRIADVQQATYLHDIGKIAVPDSVLFKPGKLTPREEQELRRHPVTSADILRPLFGEELALAVRHHHERYDGEGYPDGLVGAGIPEIARAMAVVDAYDAMSFSRPHQQALPYPACRDELRRCAGHQFDPDIVDAFVAVLDELDERRQAATAVAEEAAARIDAAAHARLHTRRDEERPEYAQIARVLREVRDAHPAITFITTQAALGSGVVIVVDAENDSALRSHIGEPVQGYTASDIAAGSIADANVLTVDEYGIWVCGFAFLRRDSGEVEALVCVDQAPSDEATPVAVAHRQGAARALASVLSSATARLGRARVQAVTDELTGLYNRRYFEERLGEEIQRAREQKRPLSLLFCDIDDFKGFNDKHGHAAGDQALKTVASLIEASLRQVDLAARFGGEEFTVALVDTDADGALEVARRIRASVAGERHAAGAPLTISIGVASFPESAVAKDQLLDKADWAMYLAKRQGRDRVVAFATESMTPPADA